MAIQIPRSVLELILHAARSAYPNEFGAMIRGEGNKIKEVLLLPGTVQGRKFASFRMNMLPVDSRAIGVVHSHPSGSNRPSPADVRMFGKVGNVNLIVKYPAGSVADVAGYDSNGDPQEIEVIE
jgi:proteasome lid subunit RPN8/RPN11